MFFGIFEFIHVAMSTRKLLVPIYTCRYYSYRYYTLEQSLTDFELHAIMDFKVCWCMLFESTLKVSISAKIYLFVIYYYYKNYSKYAYDVQLKYMISIGGEIQTWYKIKSSPNSENNYLSLIFLKMWILFTDINKMVTVTIIES